MIRRTFSARKLVESTKTRAIHIVPCYYGFIPELKRLDRKSVFVFTNPRSRFKDKRYTIESLNNLWRRACKTAGEDIDLYSGLKHSTCSQYLNEKGLTLGQIQIITDHANAGSVKKYAKVELDLKRQLMESGPRLVPKVIRVAKNDE